MEKAIPLSVPHMTGDEWRLVQDCFETNWVSTAGLYVEVCGRLCCIFR